MAKLDKYDIFMKMLEIIELDKQEAHFTIPEEQKQEIITKIEKMEGDIIFKQKEEFNLETGDKFGNIYQSVIATRGSIASGVIKIREAGENDLADAIHKLEKAINNAPASELSEDKKAEALELLNELTNQTAKPNRAKSVLKIIGTGLWEIIKIIEPTTKTVGLVWPIIQKLWK
jgi:hypothetical protein